MLHLLKKYYFYKKYIYKKNTILNFSKFCKKVTKILFVIKLK